MGTDIGQFLIGLMDGIDSSQFGREIHLLDFLQFLVEFVKSVDGTNPQFLVILGRDERYGIIRAVMFYIVILGMDTLEIVMSSCPDDSFLVPENATDVFVGAYVLVSDGLGRQIAGCHVPLVYSVHARHVSSHQDYARFYLA